MTLPAAVGMRRAVAGLETDWMVASDAARDLLRLAGEPGRVFVASPRRQGAFIRQLVRLHPRGYDAALIATRQRQRLAWMFQVLAGIPRVACDESAWAPRHLEEAAPEHRVESNCRLAAELVGACPPSEPRLSAPAASRDQDILLPGAWPRIGIHPGSERAAPNKRYPIDRWRIVVQELLKVHASGQVLVFFGPDEVADAPAFTGLHPRVQCVVGRGLQTVVELLGACHVVAAGDSGIGHIAGALGVATVTVAGPTQIASTHPYDKGNRVLKTDLRLGCQPCYGTGLFGNCWHRLCLTSIWPDAVIDAVLASIPQNAG